MWSIWTWRETIKRWRREADPKNLDGQPFLEYHLGCQDQREYMVPNAATVGLADDGGEPRGAPLDPFFEEQVLEEDERYIISEDTPLASVVKRV